MDCINWCSKEMHCYSKSTQKVILGSKFYINSDHILIINRVCADGIMLILYSKIDAMNQYSQPWLLYQPKCKGCPKNHFKQLRGITFVHVISCKRASLIS